jgi:POT family proton-dependent oligopeptide transporter
MNWHYGFGAAGVGMVLGLVQFRLKRHHLGDAGLHPHRRAGADPATFDKAWWLVVAAVAAIVMVVALVFQGVVRIDPVALAERMTLIIAGIGVLCFTAIFTVGGLDGGEKRRVAAILLLLLAAAMFWSGFEQMGSSLNLFAERYTQRVFGGFEIPAGWFQSLNPVFIIVLAPVFATLWVRLARRGLDLSVPAKFAAGLALLALGFLVMAAAAGLANSGGRVLPTWLVGTYLLHTIGEICLSPVGLSAVTKLAPPRFVGQMMGLWFLATSFGNLLAGLFAGRMSGDDAGQMPRLFTAIAINAAIGVALLLVLIHPLKRLMEGTSENRQP